MSKKHKKWEAPENDAFMDAVNAMVEAENNGEEYKIPESLDNSYDEDEPYVDDLLNAVNVAMDASVGDTHDEEYEPKVPDYRQMINEEVDDTSDDANFDLGEAPSSAGIDLSYDESDDDDDDDEEEDPGEPVNMEFTKEGLQKSVLARYQVDPSFIALSDENDEYRYTIIDSHYKMNAVIDTTSLIADVPGENNIPENILNDKVVSDMFTILRGPHFIWKSTDLVSVGDEAMTLKEALFKYKMESSALRWYEIPSDDGKADFSYILMYVLTKNSVDDYKRLHDSMKSDKLTIDFYLSLMGLISNKLINPFVNIEERWRCCAEKRDYLATDEDMKEALTVIEIDESTLEYGYPDRKETYSIPQFDDLMESVSVKMNALAVFASEQMNKELTERSNVSFNESSPTTDEIKEKAKEYYKSNDTQSYNVTEPDESDDSCSDDAPSYNVENPDDEYSTVYSDSDDIDDVTDGEDILSSGNETGNKFIINSMPQKRK